MQPDGREGSAFRHRLPRCRGPIRPPYRLLPRPHRAHRLGPHRRRRPRRVRHGAGRARSRSWRRSASPTPRRSARSAPSPAAPRPPWPPHARADRPGRRGGGGGRRGPADGHRDRSLGPDGDRRPRGHRDGGLGPDGRRRPRGHGGDARPSRPRRRRHADHRRHRPRGPRRAAAAGRVHLGGARPARLSRHPHGARPDRPALRVGRRRPHERRRRFRLLGPDDLLLRCRRRPAAPDRAHPVQRRAPRPRRCPRCSPATSSSTAPPPGCTTWACTSAQAGWSSPTFGKPVQVAFYRYRGDDYLGATRPAASGGSLTTGGSCPTSTPCRWCPTSPSPRRSRPSSAQERVFRAPTASLPPVLPQPGDPALPPEPQSAAQSIAESDAVAPAAPRPFAGPGVAAPAGAAPAGAAPAGTGPGAPLPGVARRPAAGRARSGQHDHLVVRTGHHRARAGRPTPLPPPG